MSRSRFFIQFANGYCVDTWYDRYNRNWVTQIVDKEGNQVGDAIYCGSIKSARHAHKSARAEAKAMRD